ncbi:MAG: hypothetical protein JW891_16765 [Candidatus Lokiarchaeota archaeon]|nr:hypothetical protein [Candidatus Lokiarchaeota archaeon]
MEDENPEENNPHIEEETIPGFPIANLLLIMFLGLAGIIVSLRKNSRF